MALCSPALLEITPNSWNDDDDHTDFEDEKFREVVFEFIERIGKETSTYECYEPNINANDFKHIELQIQAKRVEKVLELCIDQIKLVFVLSFLIQHQSDYLILYMSSDNARLIEIFSNRWFNGTTVKVNNNEFETDLNRCLDIVKGCQMNKQKFKVIKLMLECFGASYSNDRSFFIPKFCFVFYRVF